MKVYILILLFAGFSSLAFAQHQEVEDDIIESQSINGLYLAFVPSALINPWTGYQAKVSYGFRDLIQFQINGGLLYGERSKFRFSGYRVRPAVKIFFPAGSQVSDRFYLGVEYNIRKIKETGEANYARFGGAFVEELPFERITKSRSFILTFGSRSVLDELFYIETGMGFGVGPIKVSTTEYGNADYLSDPNVFRSYQEQGEYSMLNVLLHISIGMKIF